MLSEVNNQKGTYAGVTFSDDTVKDISDYIKTADIPNPVDSDKLHTTLLYSRKYLPKYEPKKEYVPLFKGTPVKMEKWPSQPDEDGKVSMCLVLLYECPELSERHDYLMKEHNATYDYDKYKPHITLSYDVGNLKVSDLPDFEKDIQINGEYSEDLNLNWAKDNS